MLLMEEIKDSWKGGEIRKKEQEEENAVQIDKESDRKVGGMK
jgi:hypothetical protein